MKITKTKKGSTIYFDKKDMENETVSFDGKYITNGEILFKVDKKIKFRFYDKKVQGFYDKKKPFTMQKGTFHNHCAQDMSSFISPPKYEKISAEPHNLVDTTPENKIHRVYLIAETSEVFLLQEKYATILDVISDELKVARNFERSAGIFIYKNSEYIGVCMPVLLDLDTWRMSKHDYLKKRIHHDQ